MKSGCRGDDQLFHARLLRGVTRLTNEDRKMYKLMLYRKKRCEDVYGSRETRAKQLNVCYYELFIRPTQKPYLHVLCIFHRGGFNKISATGRSFLVSFVPVVPNPWYCYYYSPSFDEDYEPSTMRKN